MPTYSLKINGQSKTVDTDPQTPLLWVIREHLGLMGTKFGCGISQCGACTVHVDGHAMKACSLPVAAMATGQEITTIEGLSKDGSHPLQKAWVEAQVPQCGYCQSGQIMQAATLLDTNPNPSREDILNHMRGNLCRCGTYMRILKAVQLAAEASQGQTSINEE
uniref:(2Fe-2S)-binding protein n=1 Tax=Roseihalotalea indica TaxID=2867963 RepID=A0AA49GMM8_9BACT|nr:(2Fe-2S)-binding protein [Tunicatimonas sp. TK19036]